MERMQLYDALRRVPIEAKKEIGAGRLKGKTDINPMWRIKALTQQFGPCGFGWRYEIKEKRLENGAGGTIAAFVDIELYLYEGERWSAPIPGTGGSMFVAEEKNGLYTSDECFKMALTDAISVACKALGVGADVYWEKDSTKYDKPPTETGAAQRQPSSALLCDRCAKPITEETGTSGKTISAKDVAFIRHKKYGAALCSACAKEQEAGAS